jgi:hypothetical protein
MAISRLALAYRHWSIDECSQSSVTVAWTMDAIISPGPALPRINRQNNCR